MMANEAMTRSDFVRAADLLRSLIAKRKLLKEALVDPAVAEAFQEIGAAVSRGEGQQRLEAVSLLGKAAEVSVPVASHVLPFLRAGLRSPLPQTGNWGSADDRYYLAKGLATSDESWVAEYASVELAQGDVAERSSRVVWAEIAVSRAQTLASTLKIAARALSEDQKVAGYSVDTAVRKLNRVAIALGEPLSLADVPPGEGFGKAFSALVSQAGRERGPESRALLEEATLVILDLMAQVLRLKFPVTLDSDIYRAAGIVLGWWKPASPPEIIQVRANRIVRIGMSALHTLARQGVSQKNVRQALVSAFGSELVNKVGNEITSKDPSLDPTTASWLSTGRALAEVRSNSAVREISDQALDEVVAKLLLAVDNQEGGPQTLESLADELELFEPSHAMTIRNGAKRSRLIVQWARAIAEYRNLSLFGERSELVPYDPALHETVSGLQISARSRLKVPGVMKQPKERPAYVVLKAVVEKP
jgi:hypothetical protein